MDSFAEYMRSSSKLFYLVALLSTLPHTAQSADSVVTRSLLSSVLRPCKASRACAMQTLCTDWPRWEHRRGATCYCRMKATFSYVRSCCPTFWSRYFTVENSI